MEKFQFNCKISDIAFYLPPTVIDNAELATRYNGWDENKIFEKTGIRKRHVVREDEHVSDLAVNAAKKLFKQENINPNEIEILILCTQTPDYALPGSSYIVHERLGLLKSCITFDFNQGCTGFIYGLFIVSNLIHSGHIKNALLITAETYSRWCHPLDKSVSTIFGDGAAAIYVRFTKDESKVGPFIFGTDGKGVGNLIVPYSGSHGMLQENMKVIDLIDESGNVRNKTNLYMNGPEMFRFVLSTVPKMIKDLLKISDKKISDIDKFVFHQANMYILRHLQKTLEISDNKMIYELEDIGNTVSSSIPIALKMASDKRNISKGDNLLLAAFGLGYSWAGAILTWDPDLKNYEI